MLFISCFSFGIFFYIILDATVCIMSNSERNDDGKIKRFRRSGHEDEDEEEGHGDHNAVINELFHDYDSTSSPSHGKGHPTNITVSVHLISLDSISDENMEYTIDVRMTLSWIDNRLTTPECKDETIKDCEDQFDMKSKVGQMWTPDVYFVNARNAKFHDQPVRNEMIYLVATGQVILSKRLTLTLLCPMDLQLYPLDTQKCPLLICPYSLIEEDLMLEWNSEGIGALETDHQCPQKFRLYLPIKTGSTRMRYRGPDVSGYFSCVNATFILEREYGYHLAYSYTVTLFIVVVSWISFWLDVSAVPARVTLGVTTLLTLITTANFVRSSLPPITYVTAIDVWVGFCSLFVFAALLEFPLSTHLSAAAKNQSHLQMSRSRVFVMEKSCRVHRSNLKPPESENVLEGNGTEKQKIPFNIDKVCRIGFPGCFIVFNIAYWSYYIPQSKAEINN